MFPSSRTVPILLLMIGSLGASEQDQASSTESRAAQESPTQEPLPQLFDEGFGEGVQDRFKQTGAVDWAKDAAILSEGSRLTRLAQVAEWARVRIRATPRPTTSAGRLRLWFSLNGATDCCVELIRSADSREQFNVRVIDTNLHGGRPPAGMSAQEDVIRSFTTAVSGPEVVVSYRHGLIGIGPEPGCSYAWIRNDGAPIETLAVEAAEGSWEIDHLTAHAQARPAALSKAEQESYAQVVQGARQVVALYRAAKYREAARAGRAALGHYDKLPRKDSRYTELLNNVAECHGMLHEYRQAYDLLAEAVEIDRRRLGKWSPDYAILVDNLAKKAQNSTSRDEAERLFREALRIHERVQTRQSTDYANTVNNLASLLNADGRRAESLKLHLESLAIREQLVGRNHALYSNSLNNLTLTYLALGDYARAVETAKECVAIRAHSSAGNRHRATALQNLALCYQNIGDLENAEEFYLQALEHRQEETDPMGLASTLSNLGTLYSRMNRFGEAIENLERAVEIRRRVMGADHPMVADAIHNLGSTLRELDDVDGARVLYEQARAIYRRQKGTDMPAAMYGTAEILKQEGRFEEARKLFEQIVEIRLRQYPEKDHPMYSAAINNLGAVCDSMGDYRQAVSLYGEALEAARRVYGPNHLNCASSLGNLALAHQALGNVSEAERLFGEAIETARRASTSRASVATHLDNLAGFYLAQGRYRRALAFARESLRTRQSVLAENADGLAERHQLSSRRDLGVSLSTLVTALVDIGEPTEEALQQSVLWKGATLVRQSDYRRIAADAGTSDLLRELRQTSARRFSLVRNPPQLVKGESADSRTLRQQVWQRQFDELSARRRQLESELGKASRSFRDRNTQVSPAVLRAQLPANTALIDYLLFRRSIPDPQGQARLLGSLELVAHVLRADGEVTPVPIGPVAAVRTAIEQWRGDFGETDAGQTAARRLRELLWEPLVSQLDGVQTVLLSPDGPLGTFPFAALPGKADQTYLIEDYRIAVIPVPQLLPELAQPRSSRNDSLGDFLLIGDIDYEGTGVPTTPRKRRRRQRSLQEILGRMTFEPLPETGVEVTQLHALYRELFEVQPGDVKLLRGSAATEAAFLNQAPRFENLHIATHGFFAGATPRRNGTRDSTNPQLLLGHSPGVLSGLALAGANRTEPSDEGDGVLTAEEIAYTALRDADLVVLSACETALGAEAGGGAGLIGLQRAFQIAGARTTIGSLWRVDDIATRQLMDRFYRNYWAKDMSRLDALREAQLWMLRNPPRTRGEARTIKPSGTDTQRRTSPRYWAPFVLSGDWR